MLKIKAWEDQNMFQEDSVFSSPCSETKRVFFGIVELRSEKEKPQVDSSGSGSLYLAPYT